MRYFRKEKEFLFSVSLLIFAPFIGILPLLRISSIADVIHLDHG